LQFLVFRLKHRLAAVGMQQTLSAVLQSVCLCKIPHDVKGVIVDGMKGQILVPVQIAITANHIKFLKSYLSDDVASIEAGNPTA